MRLFFKRLFAVLTLGMGLLLLGIASEAQSIIQDAQTCMDCGPEWETHQAASYMELFRYMGRDAAGRGYTLDLVDYANTGSMLELVFVVENHNASVLSMSEVVPYSDYDADQVHLCEEPVECCPTLSGKVLPGDRLRGALCFPKSPASKTTREGKTIILLSGYCERGICGWYIYLTEAGAVEPVSSRPNSPVFAVHKAGEEVHISGQSVALNEASIQGSLLQASFTIWNSGRTDLEVSPLRSFEARDGSGTRLRWERAACRGAELAGVVHPGEVKVGNLCWKAEGEGQVKIYYEAEGSEPVVWALE
jgi:hypothetical protein